MSIHKFPNPADRPKKSKKQPKLEEIDTKSLPVIEAGAIDKSKPYYELITRTKIFRGQTLTLTCLAWEQEFSDEQESHIKDCWDDFEILTISTILWVNGEETSFSIN